MNSTSAIRWISAARAGACLAIPMILSPAAARADLPSQELQAIRAWDVDHSSETPPPGVAAENGYSHLSFSDEFSGKLDTRKWWNRLWYQRASDVAGSDQAYGADGLLHVRLKQVDGKWLPLNLVSMSPGLDEGRVFRYGYFEARIKLPTGANLWPSFWLLSAEHAENSMQPAAEFDVVEGSSSHPTKIVTTLHRASDRASDRQNDNNIHELPTSLVGEFHVYGALWMPDRVEWFVDGQEVGSAPTYDTSGQAMMMILGISPGDVLGNEKALPTDPSDAANEMQVDWVRVWQSPVARTQS